MSFKTYHIIPILLLMAMQSAAENTLNVRVIGEAFDLRTREPLYTETHCVSDDSVTHEVIYRDTEQKMLARKTLNYTSGPLTPSFVQRNFYSDEVISVELNDDRLILAVKDEGSSAPKTSNLTVSLNSAPLVIDAGFDAFVIQHWNSLVAGETKRFQFPVRARESLIELRLAAAPCSYDANADQCFLLEIDNWLLAMVVPSIELGYNAAQRRLTRFRGLSNIGDGKGDGQSVDIRYRYQDMSEVCTMNDSGRTVSAAL